MSVKVIALGNLLMEDDGIAVYLARILEPELAELGIEVICAETDVEYLFDRIHPGDYLILMDASCQIPCGSVECYPIEGGDICPAGFLQHDYSFFMLHEIYCPDMEGILISIGIAEIGYHYGLSSKLSDQAENLARYLKQLMKSIWNTIPS